MSLRNKEIIDIIHDPNIRLDVIVISESDYLPTSPTSEPSVLEGKNAWWKFWR